MNTVVSITSQGQLTIPIDFRRALGITGHIKAIIKQVGNTLIVEPKTDFWSLGGSLKSSITATDSQLKEARQNFAKQWTRK